MQLDEVQLDGVELDERAGGWGIPVPGTSGRGDTRIRPRGATSILERVDAPDGG